MLSWLRRFITPPIFEDEEKTRIARLLQVVMMAIIICTALIGLSVPIMTPARLSRLWLNIILIGLAVANMALLRRGYVRQAAVLFALVMWGAVAYASATVGGIDSAAFAGYIIVIIFVGLTIGQRASIIAAGFIFLNGLLLVYAQNQGLVRQPETSPSLIGSLLIHTFFAFVAALLLSLAASSINQALARARQGEKTLAERNRELQAEINERKRVEEALRASDLQLRMALKSARMRAWNWDFDTQAITTIDDHIPDVNFDWVTFEQYSARIHPDDRELVQKATQLAIDNIEPYIAEYRALSSSGEYVWLESIGQVQRDAQGVPLAMIGVSHDITERKDSEEQRLELRFQKERLTFLTEFMSNMSHDVRTPLTIIKTSIYLLEQMNDPEKLESRLQVMKEQVDLVERYIQDILTISQLDHTPEVRLEQLDINPIVQQVQERLRPAIERKNLSVTSDLAASLPPALADQGQIEHLFSNLLENALNYTPTNGSVHVLTCREDEMVVFQVADTGIGIPEGDIDRIFNRFYRGDNARQKRKAGTGLGLAIVQKIVDIHHGKIAVTSQVGVGSTFRVALPTVAD